MSFIVTEGLDRSGKSSLANHLKSQGYEVVHMSAPSKKYFSPGYTGPSYCDEILDLYMKYDGKNVVFDRSSYGEKIWPQIYNRKPLLNDEEYEILREFEDKNDTQYILMYDENVEAHWKRCVDNKEPLTKSQFAQARRLYEKMAADFNFEKKQLKDFNIPAEEIKLVEDFNNDKQSITKTEENKKTIEQYKLDRANAINSILSMPKILKKSDPIMDSIEKEIREFLNDKLASIFNNKKNNNGFSDTEMEILKMYCQRIIEKMPNGGKK